MSSNTIILGAGEKYTVLCTSAITVTGSITDCMGRVFDQVRQVVGFGEGCTITADSYTTLDITDCKGKANMTASQSWFLILGVFLLLAAIGTGIGLAYKCTKPVRPQQYAQHADAPDASVPAAGGL